MGVEPEPEDFPITSGKEDGDEQKPFVSLAPTGHALL